MYDVVTIGETMLRFTPIENLRWQQADRFEMHIGGSESNLAVGLARLGHRVAWISRLTNNSFGKGIASQIASHGVDTQHVLWTDQDRIGIYFFEQGFPPRSNRVIYDRAGSSFSRWREADLDESLFLPDFARYLHVSGISLGLGETTQSLIHRSVVRAKEAGWRVSFDVNYRAKLWHFPEARKACESIMKMADLIFLPIRDARNLWQLSFDEHRLVDHPSETAQPVIESLAKLFPNSLNVMTLGEQGACAVRDGDFAYASTRAVPPIGRLGGGDAFAAGFLSGLMRFDSLQAALRWGNAAAQVKYSISGDLPLFEYDEVSVIASDNSDCKHDQQNFR